MHHPADMRTTVARDLLAERLARASAARAALEAAAAVEPAPGRRRLRLPAALRRAEPRCAPREAT